MLRLSSTLLPPTKMERKTIVTKKSGPSVVTATETTPAIEIETANAATAAAIDDEIETATMT